MAPLVGWGSSTPASTHEHNHATFPESALAVWIGVQWLVVGVGVTLIVALLAVVLFLPGHRRYQESQLGAAE